MSGNNELVLLVETMNSFSILFSLHAQNFNLYSPRIEFVGLLKSFP